MSKNKYTPDGGLKTVDGEQKQRDHTKTGKLLQRKETRRLEAIARQTRRIMEVEKALKGGKVDPKITAYIGTFKKPEFALVHANLSLRKVRGGEPGAKLAAEWSATVNPKVAAPAVVVETKPGEEKPKNKYRRKKQLKSTIKNQNGDPI